MACWRGDSAAGSGSPPTRTRPLAGTGTTADRHAKSRPSTTAIVLDSDRNNQPNARTCLGQVADSTPVTSPMMSSTPIPTRYQTKGMIELVETKRSSQAIEA